LYAERLRRGLNATRIGDNTTMKNKICPLKEDAKCSDCSFWVDAILGDHSFHDCVFIKTAHEMEILVNSLKILLKALNEL
jgi:hypothetical protein